MILFGSANANQAKIVEQVLKNLWASGQRVSMSKSKMLVAHNIPTEQAAQLSQLEGIDITKIRQIPWYTLCSSTGEHENIWLSN